MNKQPVVHEAACIAAAARGQAYDLLWPNHCKRCHGWGGSWYSFDPSPRGLSAPSLGPGSMQDFDTCACVDRGDCPRCGQKLAGPAWRPINLREQASRRLFGVAHALQHARPEEQLVRAAWWRAAALFREDPNSATWAVYHVADKLWERVYPHYDRPTKAAKTVFAVQAWLERGVYDERPCWYCGWNWGKGADDGRTRYECECWRAAYEQEQAELDQLLEQEAAERQLVERMQLFAMRLTLQNGQVVGLFVTTDAGETLFQPLERITLSVQPAASELGEDEQL